MMSGILHSLRGNKFVKNVTIVASGTAFSQAFAMIATPIIARMYGPENMGILGVFTAMAAIVTKISAFTYPVSIVLPKKDEDAKQLAYASLMIALLFASLTTIVIFFFNEPVTNLFKLDEIASFLYFIPLVIIFSASLQVAQQWLIRKKLFKLTATSLIYKTFIVHGAKIGVGLFHPAAFVLVCITTAGYLLHALMIAVNYKFFSKLSAFFSGMNPKRMMQLLKSYRDFPLFRAPQELMNGISSSLPVFMLSIFFGPVFAGFYSISRTVLKMPTELIGKSIGDVFYPRIAQAANKGENISALMFKATAALAVVGIFPFGIVFLFGPWLFELVFGSEWVQAGEYARWLSIWLFFGFINTPSVKSIPVLKLQGSFLIYEIMSAVIRAAAFCTGYFIFKEDIAAIILLSVVSGLLNLYLVLFTFRKAKTLKGI